MLLRYRARKLREKYPNPDEVDFYPSGAEDIEYLRVRIFFSLHSGGKAGGRDRDIGRFAAILDDCPGTVPTPHN